MQNKRDGQLKFMRKKISKFLQAGEEAIARIRVEHVIRQQNIWAAYEILEMFCGFVLARVPILESQRCSDLQDRLHVRNLFAAKYRKEFISAASELQPDTSVNHTNGPEKIAAPPASASGLDNCKHPHILEHSVTSSNVQRGQFDQSPSQRARAAIAAAEHASSAARAAAELVNFKFSTVKLEQVKS
ncbi:hypothetical protein ACH5RR_036172 [Cinchona calisaya]|uniref:IST1-like protein n=1 Tax=Cinchona calisaya TaxID=153742 RepID=A0ABD2Y7X1_9GENT